MKSYQVHYANKYPGCRIHADEDGVDVYGADGEHKIAIRKNGAGQLVDRSEEFGCSDRHDLSPIPKNARFMKLQADGKIARAEEYDQRKPIAHELAKAHGKVPSIEELKAKGHDFDEKGNWKKPAPQQSSGYVQQ